MSSLTKIRTGDGLRKLLSDDPGQVLLYALEEAAARYQGDWRRPLRRALWRQQGHRSSGPGWVHVTDALSEDICDRALAGLLLGYRLPRERIGAKLGRIFDTGTYMHLRWQGYFLLLPSRFEVEVAKVLRHWPLVGEADVVVRHPDLGNWVVELKSINTNEFSGLREPKEAHRWQLNTYQGLDSELGGMVWYEDKNNQDVKTFAVQLDEERYLSLMLRCQHIADYVESGRLPKACGSCEADKLIADLRFSEERWSKFRDVKREHDRREQR